MINETNIFGAVDGDSLSPENTVDMIEQVNQPTSVVTDQIVPTSYDLGTVALSASRTDDALPEGPTIIGRHKFIIPDKAGQLAGFEVESPGVLVGQFSQYKFKTTKGQNTPKVTI